MNAMMRFACLGIIALLQSDRAMAETKVVFLGDSVTKAVRPGVTAEQTFCHYFQKAFRGSGIAVEAINAGVGGHTTADGLTRFDRDVLEKRPSHVVIMFGLNDSWIDSGKSASRLTVARYRDNLRTMIAALRGKGIEVVLMTPNPTAPPTCEPARNVTLKPYVEAVRELAAAERIGLVDVYRKFAELAIEGVELNTLFTDGIHPNPAGQRLIADMLVERFRPLLTDGR